MPLPVLADYLEPTAFIERYKDIELKELAPSLGALVEKRLFDPKIALAAEIQDTETFLEITDFNESLCEALSEVIRGLRSVEREPKTIMLTHEMGFGKTHFLVLLWHLFVEVPQKWSSLKDRFELSHILDLLRDLGYEPRIAKRIVVVAADMLSLLGKTNPYEYMLESAARIVERRGECDLANAIRGLKDKDELTAAEELAEILLDEGCKLLVLIDEIYAAVLRCVRGKDKGRIDELVRVFNFLTHLLDAVKGRAPAVIVAASAQQDINRWESEASAIKAVKPETKLEIARLSLIHCVEEFDERARRRATISMRETKAEDALRIVLKRLFKEKAPIDDAKASFLKEARHNAQAILAEDEAIETFIRRAEEAFPFAPTYVDFASKLMGQTGARDLPKSQHIRDLIRITARVVSRMMERGCWNIASLISPIYITHDDLKHLIPESYAQVWSGLYKAALRAIESISDEDVRLLTNYMFTIVYIKSLTTNIMRLLEMIRRPEKISTTEVLVRGTSDEDLAYSLIGAVEDELLAKIVEARQFLSKHTPYVVPVTKEGHDYLILTFIPNPRELIESFRNEELAKLKTPSGEYDPSKLADYLREHFVKMDFEEKMRRQASVEGMKLELVDLETLLDSERAAELFNKIKEDTFTMIIVSPWSVADFVAKSPKVDYIELARRSIEDIKDKIRALNLFCVVIPSMDLNTLKHLCVYIADIEASRRVIEFLKGETERRALIERDPACRQLKALEITLEEEFERIILEAIEKMQKRIEEYASSLAVEKVNSYAADLCRTFNTIVFYDPEKRVIISDKLSVSPATRRIEDVSKIYGELPVWLAKRVKVKCKVSGIDELRSHLIRYIGQYAIEHKEELLEGEEVEISEEFLINALTRGWDKLPVKPESLDHVSKALDLIRGKQPVKEPALQEIEVSVKEMVKGTKKARVITIVKPKPRIRRREVRRVTREPSYMGIKIREIDSAILGIDGAISDEEARDLIRKMQMSIKLRSGATITLRDISPDDLEAVFKGRENLLDILNEARGRALEMILQIEFSEALKERAIKRITNRWGLKEGAYELIEAD